MPVATKAKRVVHQKAKGPIDPGVGHKIRHLPRPPGGAPPSDRQDVEFMLLRAEQERRAGHHKVAADIADTWTRKSSGVLRARFQRLQARALIESDRKSTRLNSSHYYIS